MHPILFEIGGFPIYTYGVLLAAAYLLGLQFALKRARQRGLDPNRVMDLGIWIIVSALAGAKLLLLIVEWDTYTASFSQLLTLVRSGGVFYGGLIAAVTVALWYSVAPSHARLAGHRRVRTGNCPGSRHRTARVPVCRMLLRKTHSVPWAITFHDKYAEQNVGTPLEVPLHPTQLYEAGAELLILVVLLVTERKGRPFPGRTFWGYMLLYGISRFIIEFYRGDSRGAVGMFSTSQFVSLLIIPLSIVMLVYLRRRSTPEPTSATRRARAA